MRRIVRTHPKVFPSALFSALAILSPGCFQEAGLPKDASPVVQSDSEQAKRALAERDEMLKEREQQEANARKRMRALPEASQIEPAITTSRVTKEQSR